MYSNLNREEAILALEKSQTRVAGLEETVRQLKMRIELLNKRIEAAEPKAQHFDILIKAIKENSIVSGAWDKFMMALRIAGYDKSE